MRAIWNGVVSFGLVSVAVRLYAATYNHDIRFHQVHDTDGGRIRYRRVCEVCNKEVEYADLAKGYETEDGELVTLDADDMASLPLSSSREIEVVEFVPTDQIDPLLLDRSYYLEPDAKAVKPYALLREALRKADQVAVVKVALRQRETLALLRVRDDVIVMQTMLWPDEVRTPDFETLGAGVDLRPQELQMASVLIGSLQGEFDPSQFDDSYRKAVEDLIDYKRQHGGARPVPAAATTPGEPVSDLLTALRRSVEEARSTRAGSTPSAVPTSPTETPAPSGETPAPSGETPAPSGETLAPAKAPAPKKSRARKPTADKSAAKPAAAKPSTDKPTATKPTATKPTATKPTATKPTATKPTATKPTATKPTATKPTATKPTATKPTADKPVTTKTAKKSTPRSKRGA